ncbi:MAG: TnpV protein [bacterium]|nr:TnpV protein [bacterium]
MEISYTKYGDYFIPNLTVPDKHYNIGKYGMLRREYLRQHRPAAYTVMMLNGTLLKHLDDVDKICHKMLDRLVPQMAEREGVTEELKAADQIEWVRRMCSIKSRVEEILYHDYVYEEAYENEEI